jgi:hypothetical protein
MWMVLALALQDPAALVDRLGDDAIDAREKAAAELRRLGEGAVGALEDGLRHADAEVRARSLELLLLRLKALPPAMIARHAPLREARLARDVDGLMARLNAGGAWTGSKTREALLEASADMRSMRALGAEAVPLLVRELDGPRAWPAAMALGLFDDARAVEALDGLSADDPPVVVYH